ncbi:MAG TPA: asparagine synthase-related protein, partial [Acidimicrobiales bacterium]|nr:asparagine synthase-related protein [Acidimicrobiales bacterium]
ISFNTGLGHRSTGPRSSSPTGIGNSEAKNAGLFFAEGGDRLCQHLAGESVHLRAQTGWRDIAAAAIKSPGQLDSLPGDFGFIAFGDGLDEGSQECVAVVRSCGGLAPFHLYEYEGVVAISTRVADLIQYLPQAPEPDPLVWATFASGVTEFPDGRGFLRHSRIVPRGHVALVSIDPRASRTACGAVYRPARMVKYFDPRPASWPVPSGERRAEHVARLKGIILGALEADLDREGMNVLSLSGGVDSSVLGALAAGELDFPVASISQIPPPSSKFHNLESGYIKRLGQAAGIDRQVLVGQDLGGWLASMSVAPSAGFPCGNPFVAAIGDLAGEIPFSVAFGGEHADEVCGSFVTIPDWAMATRIGELARSLGRLPSGPKDLVRWFAWRAMWALGRPRLYMRPHLPPVVVKQIRDEYDEWFNRMVKSGSGPGPWRFLSTWHRHDGWTGNLWEILTGMGIRRSMPFMTREALELVYDCHPSELVGPGPKKLLRQAFSGMVPQDNLMRADKGSPLIPSLEGTHRWVTAMPGVVEPIIGSPRGQADLDFGFPDIMTLTLLERAGRSFEELRRAT